MKKKLLLLTVLVLTFVCLFAVIASASEFSTVETIDGIDLTGMNSDSTARVVLFDGTNYHTYPSNYIVTNAETLTFDFTKITGTTYTKSNIVRLEIPKGITTVPSKLFQSNTSLIELKISDDVTLVESYAFDSCKALKTINFGTGLKTVKDAGFKDLKVIEYVNVPSLEAWLNIEFQHPYERMSNPVHYAKKLYINGELLTNLVIPEGTTAIKLRMFSNCESIKTVSVPKSVTKFGKHAFEGCTGIVRCDYTGTIIDWVTGITFENGTASPAKYLYINGEMITHFEVPQDLKTMKNFVFGDCKSVTSIKFHSNFTGLNCSLASSYIESLDITMLKITELPQDAFYASHIRNVKLPSTIKTIKSGVFRDCKELVFVDFGNNTNSISADTWGVWMNCTSLKAISLPDGMKVIPNRGFAGCTSLTSVYLPADLERIAGNQGDNQAAFYNCPNLYFVNEPFSVTRENGDFYASSEWDDIKPVRPTVYYFPSGLTLICSTGNPNKNITTETFINGMTPTGGNDDIGFSNCTGLNPVLVLPEGFTGYDEITDTKNTSQQGDMLGAGLFKNCGTATNPITVVFLGRIDRVSMDRKDGATKYTTYVFANEANTGFENTLIGTWYNTTDSNYKNQDEMYVVFCHAAGGAQKYKINFEGSADNNKMPVLKTTLQTKEEGSDWHIYDPRNEKNSITPATCIKDAYGTIHCFCNAEMGTQQILGTATGIHICEDDNNCTTPSEQCTADPDCDYFIPAKTHTIVHTLAYANGFNNSGVYNHHCTNTNCTKVVDTDNDGIADAEIIDQTSLPIITAKGWSTPEKVAYFGINAGYEIDSTLLAKYETLNNDKVTLGLFIVGVDSVKSVGAILDSNCEIVENVKGFKVSISSDGYSKISIELRGFEQGENNAGNYYTLNLISAMYVKTKDGIKYIQTSLSDDSTENRVVINEGTFNTISADRIYTSIANKQ